MKTAILGFGMEGKSTLKYLKKKGQKLDIKVLDKKFDKNYLKNLADFDVVYRSAGVPFNLPEIQKAIKKGVKLSSSTILFLENAKGKIIAVTGTKGKGTTSTLIYKILKNAGFDTYLVGNIGKPALDILHKLTPKSVTVLELSSFQLQDIKLSPHIAVVLDIFPDHLDVHKSFKEYIESEAQVISHQKPNDKVFYFDENKYSKLFGEKSKAKKTVVNLTGLKNPYISPTNIEEMKNIIKIPGEHNLKNALMAATVTRSLGVPKKIILKIISQFTGNKYRIQKIRKINNITFYNDSGSTNPGTVTKAVLSFGDNKILIVGGKDKNLDYKPLKGVLRKSKTELVILLGESKYKIQKTIKDSGVLIELADNLESAVKIAYKKAQESKENISIIFSPGAASFDMFTNYEERGKFFNKIVKSL